MILRVLSALVALVFVVSAVALAQDVKQVEKEKQYMEQKAKTTEQEAKAKEKQKMETEQGAMKMFNCPAPCNFKVQSKDEQEVVDAASAHLKKHHNMTLSESEIKSKMKVEGTKDQAEPKKTTAEPKKEKPKQ